MAAHQHHARGGLDHVVVGWPVLPSAFTAPAADGAVDEAWIRRSQRGVAEAVAIEHARAQAVDEYVCFVRERECLLAIGRVVQIQREGAFSGIQGDERSQPLASSHDVTAAAILHLDDLCAQLGQIERRKRPRDHVREIEHPDAGQRLEFAHDANLVVAERPCWKGTAARLEISLAESVGMHSLPGNCGDCQWLIFT